MIPPHRPKQPESYRSFNLDDYPAYQFQPDGTPVRVVPATRGAYAGWTGPIRSYTRVPHTGHEVEMFGITRGDGTQRQVSRNTILKALGSAPAPASAAALEDPWEGPADCLFPRRSIDDYPDYVVDALGRVYRFQSPGRGRYARPFLIGTVSPGYRKLKDGSDREGYYNLDCVTGHRRYLSRAKVLDLAGWTEKEIRDARTLEIATT